MAIREGKWRCPYCSVANRGAAMACTGCGATRDKDVAFFLEDDAEEVTDDALIARARAGADWLCTFCGDSNASERDHCRNCGAEKGSAPSRPVVEPGTAGVRSERSEDPRGRLHAVEARSNPAPVVVELGGASGAPPKPPSRYAGVNPVPLAVSPVSARFRPWGVAVLLVLVALVMAAAYFGLRRTEETLTVAGFEWERHVAVEAWRTVREQAWEGSVPAGARVVSRRQEVHHTERDQVGTRRVKAGHRDLGNGFFEDVYRDEPVYRERPVYRTRVAYDVDRWVPDRTVRASGQDHAAHWPDPQLRTGEREASRAEKLVVLLNGKRIHRMELPEARWVALQPGQAVSAVMRGGWSVLELK